MVSRKASGAARFKKLRNELVQVNTQLNKLESDWPFWSFYTSRKNVRRNKSTTYRVLNSSQKWPAYVYKEITENLKRLVNVFPKGWDFAVSLAKWKTVGDVGAMFNIFVNDSCFAFVRHTVNPKSKLKTVDQCVQKCTSDFAELTSRVISVLAYGQDDLGVLQHNLPSREYKDLCKRRDSLIGEWFALQVELQRFDDFPRGKRATNKAFAALHIDS